MKKIAIIIISLFLLLSAVNFGTSKPIMNYDSNPETENAYDNSVIDNVQEQKILLNINRLDGFFTENQGQVGNDSVRYYIQGKGVWFLDDGVVFEIKEPINENEAPRDSFDRFHPESKPKNPAPRKRVVLKLNFEGCNDIKPKGIGLLPHRNNYFYGNDSSKWCTNVPNYQEITYVNIYDNIDLRYYSSDKGLKYDFVVRPGGNLKNIILRYNGVNDLNVNGMDNLIIKTNLGNIVDSELFIYQISNNVTNIIEGKFIILDSKTYGFRIWGEYDCDKELVIDPLVYSTFIGGSSWDQGYGIALDSNCNAYITGNTGSSNFPTTPGAHGTTHNGNWDVFMLKLNPTGSSLLYSTFIGGSDRDYGYGIALDSSGNAHVIGDTYSSNFPTTPGANDTTPNGDLDVFVLKLNPTGSSLMYSTFVGGSDNEEGQSIAIDSTGSAYVTGSTASSNFPTTAGANDTTYNYGYDVFVLKLNPTGSTLLYSTFVGGFGDDWGYGIALDSTWNAYVTGYTEPFDFPTTPGVHDTTHNGFEDVFVLKLNPTGSTLLYSTYVGGSDYDRGYGIALDSTGNAYVTGGARSSDFPTNPGAPDTTLDGFNDGFVLKLNPTGSTLLYSTFIGGSDLEWSHSIAIDSTGNAYVTGYTESSDFPTTTGAYDTIYNGHRDVFVLKLNPTGSSLLYSTFIGGSESEWSHSIAIDSTGNTYVTGITYSSNFPTTPNANDTTFNGWVDGFMLKFNFFPSVIDLTISKPIVLRTNSIYLYSNATDIEDLEQNLTPKFEYRDPNEQVWNSTYFSNSIYNNSRWEVSFTPPKNAILGLYDFRVRFNDTSMLFSDWFYLNDTLLVYNTAPNVIDIKLSENPIYRTNSVFLYVNGTDYETPEEMLVFYVQYKPQSEAEWSNLKGKYLNNTWEIGFITTEKSILGYYDFRAKFEDNETVSSGWEYLNDSLEVLNNPPIISTDLDDISVGIQPLILDLTPFESDIENTDINLIWSIEPQIYTYIKSIGIIDTLNDTLKIVPKENLTGTEDIELTLTDKDSGTVIKSDITIFVDSTISEFTPKVNLLSPPDKSTVNTLTPTFKWELDYSGAEIITYSLALDENPDLLTINKTGLTTTEYTLENELVDGKTYYWKVEPTNGICVSGSFSFTIDLGFEPIYKVNLTTERESVTIKQGELKSINLTVTNEGNVIDNFKIEISLANIQSQINIDKTNVQLDPDIDSIVKLSIDIPDDFTTGNYSITVTATSLSDITAKGEVTIDVKVVSKDFEPYYDVSISISPTSLTLKQGDSENVTITITNDGNIKEDFTIRPESDDFTSDDIKFSKSSLPLTDGDSDTITVTIKIPEDMQPGVYTIKFIVESNDEPKESILTITVKDSDGNGDEDNTMLYALVGIIVIIIVVLILMFIFLKKKKGKEEPQVEEAQPPIPEVPPEQPPPPKVTPQVTQPQVVPSSQPAPIPQVVEQPVPQVEQHQVEVQEPQGQALVPKIKTEPTIKENDS